MSVTVSFRGTSYTIPSPGDSNDWGTALNAFLVALAAAQPAAVLTVTVSSGDAITGSSSAGHGLVASGDATSPASSAFRIVPQDTQPSGASLVGDIYVTTAGLLKICTVAGTPGTWASVGSQS